MSLPRTEFGFMRGPAQEPRKPPGQMPDVVVCAPRAHSSSWGIPSPPHVAVPPGVPGLQFNSVSYEGESDGTAPVHYVHGHRKMILPEYRGVDGFDLTVDDLRVITQGRHEAFDKTADWVYEDRRTAQLILPFLYLGPSQAAKDRNFLREQGITLLVAVRDHQSAAARLLNPERIAKELGIQSACIDIKSAQHLIHAFPSALKLINDHLISIYRSQLGSLGSAPASFRQGKVLVYCESGNERSAAVLAAYLISVFDLDALSAMRYLQTQRFCVALDDDMKILLQTFSELVAAQKQVATAQVSSHRGMRLPGEVQVPSPTNMVSKRGRDDFADGMETDGGAEDEDRFANRASWAPFLDDDYAEGLSSDVDMSS